MESDKLIPTPLLLMIRTMDLSFRRRTTKLVPNKTSALSANDTFQVDLPSTYLVDLSSFSLRFDLDCGTGTVDVGRAESVFHNVTWRNPDSDISNINHYNRIHHTLCNWSCSTAHQKLRQTFGLDEVYQWNVINTDYDTAFPAANGYRLSRAGVTAALTSVANIIKDNLSSGTPNTVTDETLGMIVFQKFTQAIVAGTARSVVCGSFLGFPSVNCRYFETSLIKSPLSCHVQLAPDAAVVSASTYSITNMEARINTIRYSDYVLFLQNRLASEGGQLRYKFDRYVHATTPMISANTTSTYTINLTTSALKKLLVFTTVQDTAGIGQDGFGVLPYYQSARSGLSSLSVVIDGVQHPSFTNELNKDSSLFDVLEALGVAGDTSYDNLVADSSPADFFDARWLWVCAFNHDSSDARYSSGYSTMGQNTPIQIQMTRGSADANTNGDTIHFLCVCDSQLVVLPGRSSYVEW